MIVVPGKMGKWIYCLTRIAIIEVRAKAYIKLARNINCTI